MSIAPDPPPATRRRRLALLALVAVVLAAGASAWLGMRRPATDDGLLQVNGRIEGDRVTETPKLAGRVVELAVR